MGRAAADSRWNPLEHGGGINSFEISADFEMSQAKLQDGQGDLESEVEVTKLRRQYPKATKAGDT